MITHKGNPISAALGLYGSTDAWHLVKVRREADRFVIVKAYAASRQDSGDAKREIGSLFQQLSEEDRGLPVGVVLSDGLGLYRRINAPKADPSVIDKIVSAQVETLLPGSANDVCLGWYRARAEDALWFHATPRQEIDELVGLLPDGVKAVSAISDAMAAARLITADSRGDQGAALHLIVGVKRSTLMLFDADGLKQIASLDGGMDTVNRNDESDWSRQLSDSRDELLGRIPPDQRPDTCQCLCPSGNTQHMLPIIEAALGVRAHGWSSRGDVTGSDTREPAVLMAVSAAASCIAPLTPTIRLHEVSGTHEYDQRIRKYAFAAGIWLVLALGTLYLSDLYRASQVNEMLADGELSTEQISQLDKQIAVARYLEQSGPTPLAIMDEIGQKVEGYMYENFSYERAGTVRLGGMKESSGAVGKLTEDLAGMTTLDAVQLQSQSGSGKKTRYEIVANASPTYFGAFVQPPSPPPPPPDDKNTDADKNEQKKAGDDGTK